RAHALLEVCRRHDLAILGGRQTYLAHFTRAIAHCRDFDRQVRDIQPIGVEPATGQHDLEAPRVLELGNQTTDGGVAPPIAADRVENRRDVLDGAANPELFRPTAGEPQTLTL